MLAAWSLNLCAWSLMLVAPSSRSLELEAWSLMLISVSVVPGPLLVDLQEQLGQLLVLLHATFGSR